MELGEIIKNERKKRNISQQELANYLNISRQAISRWENNNSLPDLNTLILIAKYFEIPLESFTEENYISEKKEVEHEEITRDEIIREATPYILVLTAILTMVLLLPSKIKVPILFFGSILIIFFTSCLLIYYIVKNYLSSK